MFLKPHQWNMVPESRTERRLWLHQVRERTHTVMLHDKRYFDVDSGKFITDKLPTIPSLNLNDMMTRCHWTEYDCDEKDECFDDYEHQKWFTPKDDDFDAEEEKKKANIEYALARLAYENARQKEEAYQRQLRETEERLKKEADEKLRIEMERVRAEEEIATLRKEMDSRIIRWQKLRQADTLTDHSKTRIISWSSTRTNR